MLEETDYNESKADQPKDEDEIKTLIDDAINQALQHDQTELSDKRSKALEYYKGYMRDVPAAEGRSSVVSKDVSVVIGWMLPGIIRTFTGSGRIVEFEPVGPEDEAQADQASDYIDHKFLKDNDGYRVMYSSIHDALLMGDGIIKVWYDHTPEYDTHVYSGLTQEQLGLLLSDDTVEVLAQDSYEDTEETQDPTGVVVPMPVTKYDIKIRKETAKAGLKFAAVEPENFLMDKESTTIDESRFVAQRDTVTKSSLVEMGFDREVIDMIPTDGTSLFDEVELAREDDRFNLSDVADDSVQMVELYECYIKMDVDGDGMAETIKALYAGNRGSGELLEWEIWEDSYPFVSVPCEPVPHRFDSMSIADQTMDLQRIKTVLSRQMLDNVYAHNNPQPELEEGSVLNPDSVASPKFGQPIIKRRGSNPIMYNTTPFIADKALAAIQSVDQEIERRTGISRQTMSLDPDTLQNQTATAVNAQKDAATSKVELVARNMAELGFRVLFQKALKLIVKNQDKAEVIRLRGNWVEMDPQVWNAGMDCTINVGLGTGSRERDIAALNQTLGLQLQFSDRLAAQNLVQQGIEMVPKLIKTAIKIAESSGLKNGEDYFIDVSPQNLQQMAQTIQQAQQQPSPDEKKAQAEMQLEEKRIQMEMQQNQMEHQGKMAIEEKRIEQHIVREREQLNADIQTKTHDSNLKAEYQNKEIQAKRESDMRNHEIKIAELALKERELEAKINESQTKAVIEAQKLDQQREISERQIEIQARTSSEGSTTSYE